MTSLPLAIFDPSSPQPGGTYWQCASSAFTAEDRQFLAKALCSGFPVIKSPLPEKPVLAWSLGILRGSGSGYWFYRMYWAGEDSYGRGGRHFFVVLALTDPKQADDEAVQTCFDSLAGEQPVPLNLPDSWRKADYRLELNQRRATGPELAQFIREMQNIGEGEHRGREMTDGGLSFERHEAIRAVKPQERTSVATSVARGKPPVPEPRVVPSGRKLPQPQGKSPLKWLLATAALCVVFFFFGHWSGRRAAQPQIDAAQNDIQNLHGDLDQVRKDRDNLKAELDKRDAKTASPFSRR